MSKLRRLFFLLFLVFSLTSCDLWDDMVDFISGSGDDKDVEKVPEQDDDDKDDDDKDDDDKDDDNKDDDKDDDEKVIRYETRFHHTQTDGPDGGKSLVLCPGQARMNFDKCVSDGVTIPRHKDGEGRETYWNMRKEPKGDIVCTKGGKAYRYPASKTDARGFVWGKCK